MKRISYTIISLCFLFLACPAMAQRSEIHYQRIATLQVVAGSDWQAMPIIELGSDSPIHIDFDDMTHDYHRYSYRIIHCDANWQESKGIFETDYMQGFNGNLTIEDVEQSLNTNHLYTHYHLAIPNENVKLTMSGNYQVKIYDDNDEDKEILTACFMVVDPKLDIALSSTSNTDIDINRSHQQVSMNIKYGNLRITNPTEQIKTVVLQNGRWDNAVINPQPNFIRADGLEWSHNKQLIYPAGNEYRKFELLDLDHPNMGIEEIKWDGKENHAFRVTDEPCHSYVYDESGQGAFYIRNSDNEDNNTTCDYAWVHFTLKTQKQKGKVYINGNWTHDQFLPIYQMTYDEKDGCYHSSILLKQGYYSYQYLVVPAEETSSEKPHILFSEGNFYQTKNRYDVLVYSRAPGERADKLIGWKSIK